MSTSWSELEAALAGVLGVLPEGAVLQLSEAALPDTQSNHFKSACMLKPAPSYLRRRARDLGMKRT